MALAVGARSGVSQTVDARATSKMPSEPWDSSLTANSRGSRRTVTVRQGPEEGHPRRRGAAQSATRSRSSAHLLTRALDLAEGPRGVPMG